MQTEKGHVGWYCFYQCLHRNGKTETTSAQRDVFPLSTSLATNCWLPLICDHKASLTPSNNQRTMKFLLITILISTSNAFSTMAPKVSNLVISRKAAGHYVELLTRLRWSAERGAQEDLNQPDLTHACNCPPSIDFSQPHITAAERHSATQLGSLW